MPHEKDGTLGHKHIRGESPVCVASPSKIGPRNAPLSWRLGGNSANASKYIWAAGVFERARETPAVTSSIERAQRKKQQHKDGRERDYTNTRRHFVFNQHIFLPAGRALRTQLCACGIAHETRFARRRRSKYTPLTTHHVGVTFACAALLRARQDAVRELHTPPTSTHTQT